MAGSNGPFEPRILLVDDDPLTRQQLGDLLIGYFHDLSFAENGEQGLRMYQEREYDIVVTDILMPVMDGLDMATRIRGLNPAAQVVFITAYNEIEDSVYARQVANNCIMKPINIDALVDAINECKDRVIAGKGE